MIREVRDPAIINSFANHPSIRPHVAAGDFELDLSAGVCEPNVFLFGEHGGIAWMWSAPDTYEGHVMLSLFGRGRWGIEAGREAIHVMAERGARQLWGRIHPGRPEVGIYAHAIGLTDTGIRHTLDIGEGPVAWRIFNWRA